MNVAVIYIALGRYDVFWKGFYDSAEKYLLNGINKHYFMITDNEHIYAETQANVSKVYQKKMGWPYDTLYRYDMYLLLKEKLEKFDYVFFFNSNVLFVKPVGKEILPTKENDGLAAAIWTKDKKDFTYERNPQSTAYIPQGEGKYYFRGGVNGGTSKAFLQMAEVLSENTKIDMENEIVAIWHDESHLNKYLSDKNPLILDDSYCLDEVRKKFGTPVKILIRNKDAFIYGGKKYLRGDRNDKIGRWEFLLKKSAKFFSFLCPIKSYRKKLRAFYRDM